MSKLFKQTFAFQLFAVFMANMAAASFNLNWLAQKIEYSHASAHSDHDGRGDATYNAGEGEVPSAAEHQLLHAAS
ncbi:MAG: hypothetical protein V4805_08755 [Pseudomonadota bacterium]